MILRLKVRCAEIFGNPFLKRLTRRDKSKSLLLLLVVTWAVGTLTLSTATATKFRSKSRGSGFRSSSSDNNTSNSSRINSELVRGKIRHEDRRRLIVLQPSSSASAEQQNSGQLLFDYYGRRLRITPKECQSSSPRFPNVSGICMFNLECQENAGKVVGACVDKFLFGACCHIPDEGRRKALLSQAGSFNSLSDEVKESQQRPAALFSPPVLIRNNPNNNNGAKVRPPSPSPNLPTRFPPRVPVPAEEKYQPLHRVPPVDKTHPPESPVPLGQRSTLPPPPVPPTLLPLALETFSSVSHPLAHRPLGGGDALRRPNGQSHDTLEHPALGFLVVRDKAKPRPSSMRVGSSTESSSSSSSSFFPPLKIKGSPSSSITTQSPPKFSTFMYLDDEDLDGESSSNTVVSVSRPIKDAESLVSDDDEVEEKKTVPPEELQSNTENIWSVVMQLGSQDEKPQNRPANTLLADLVTSSNSIKTDEDDEDSSAPTKYPPLQFFGTAAASVEESSTTAEEGITTARPWASSTYYVHTFKYPNFTSGAILPGLSSEEDDDFYTVPSSTAQPTASTYSASTQAPVGKITTWSGVGTVVDKQQLINRLGAIMREEKRKTSPMTTTTTTTTTPSPTTTRRPTTTPRTQYTTRRTTTTTTTETPTTTTVPPLITFTTEKWKKPMPYTLPAHKRPTTPPPRTPPPPPPPSEYDFPPDEDDADLDREEKEEYPDDEHFFPVIKRRPKPPKSKPLKKDSEEDQRKPSIGSSIILDEDMDTNLDDFVEQVVQGLAGSLDNLNIDNVILNSGEGFEDQDFLNHIDDLNLTPTTTSTSTTTTKTTTTTTPAPTTTTTTTTTTKTTTQRPLDWKRDCGVRTLQKSGRIVGGTASKFGRWPWQALVKEATWLGLFSKNKCGGVLIAPKYVLTAAHCQPGFLATLTVVLGEFDISSATEGSNSVTKNVRRVIVHRDYNAQTFENDIALLELDSAVEYQSHIVPVCLPYDEEEDYIGKKAFVTGWGRLKYGGGVPQILHEVDVPILKNDECQDMFHKSNHLKAIRESFICAGYAEGFKDSCEGDSGGPLSIQRPNGQWVLAGTVSHGIKCAYPNLPGVYMRMTFYKPWIKRVTGIK